MSNLSIDSSMATTIRVSAVSEAEYGCEHLGALLSEDGDANEQFRKSFVKAQGLLSSRSQPNGVSYPPGSAKKSVSSLRPVYTCLDCFSKHANGDRKAHSQKTEHTFYMESRTGALFCQACRDLVYDHDLERLRMTAQGVYSAVSKKRTFNESSSDETYIKINATKRPCAREGVRGLFNLGQTCYANVILQTLLHDPVLTSYFLGNGHQAHDCTVTGCIACAVSDAFSESNSGEKPDGFAAVNLLQATWKASTILSGYQQQDAHEFYQFLVDKLHCSAEDTFEGSNNSCSCFFHKAFFGKIRSSVTCDKCGNITRTEDPIMDLSLDVQVQAKKRQLGGRRGSSTTPSLNGCLESFTSPERLMADVYNCSGCGGTPQKAIKQLKIKKLPAFLCMQLKRFEHTFSVSEKVETRVDFPLSINMLPYTTEKKSTRVDKSKYVYDLASAVVHKGKLDAGHYYVYCRQGDQWFLFNDDQVTSATEADVLNTDAYLLFYTLRSLST